jgi:hypothetical protein
MYPLRFWILMYPLRFWILMYPLRFWILMVVWFACLYAMQTIVIIYYHFLSINLFKTAVILSFFLQEDTPLLTIQLYRYSLIHYMTSVIPEFPLVLSRKSGYLTLFPTKSLGIDLQANHITPISCY